MNNDIISSARSSLRDAMAEINNFKYVAAFRLLHKVAQLIADTKLSDIIDDLEGRYFFMLRYLSSYARSSAPGDIDDIASKMKDIAILLSREITANDNSAYGAQLRFQRLRPEENLQTIISDYLSEAERLRTDSSALTDSKAHSALERFSADIFNRLWTAYNLDDDTLSLLDDILQDNSISVVDRELWINAIGLAILYYHDRNLLNLIIKALDNNNRRIHFASLIWLLLIATAFAKDFDKDTLSRIWDTIYNSGANIVHIYRQIIRTISKNDNDLFRDISSLSHRFNGINLNDADAIKNIDLSSDDYEKIKRFNDAQASGVDVFGRSIGNMRFFPFFASLANWFIPFDPQHTLLADITEGDGAEIAESIALMPNIADSDKYALILSLGQLPINMRAKALSTLVDGMRSMSDSQEFRDALSELKNIPDSTLIANQILQISRFVDKFPKIDEFPIKKVWKIDALFSPENLAAADIDKNDLISLAKDLFNHSNTSAAASLVDSVFNEILIESLSIDDLLFLAETSNNNAIVCLKEILIREPHRIDIAILLARRYIQSGDIKLAINTLKNADVDNSNNADALFCLADCYEASDDFENAIDTLFQADYALNDSDCRARIRLALIYIKNNMPHEALSTIDLIKTDNTNKLPIATHGIALWLSGNPKEAISAWISEMESLDNDAKTKYIRQMRNIIIKMADFPVAQNSAFDGLRLAPDILLYHINGSKFGIL